MTTLVSRQWLESAVQPEKTVTRVRCLVRSLNQLATPSLIKLHAL